MIESDFHRLADETLENWFEQLDEKTELEVEVSPGSLAIEKQGRQWLVSKHTISRQLWLASPITGGLHFNYNEMECQWRLTDGRELFAILTQELGI